MRNSASKGLQNFTNPQLLPRNATAGSESDLLHFLARAFEIVIDDHKIIPIVIQYLLTRLLQTASNLIFRILPSLPDAPLQIFPRRRQNEDSHRSRQLVLYL